jgi:hypothetical protein
VSYWTYADMVGGRCSARDIGHQRPDVDASEVIEPERMSFTPEQIVQASVRALMRAAEQTRDLGSAVKAATALLRFYVQPQALIPEPVADTLPTDSWLTARRLAYQESGSLPLEPVAEPAQLRQDAPEALDPAQTLPEPPAQPTAPRSPLHLVEPPAPQFWASPTTPAT